MTDNLSKELRSYNMSQIRSCDTAPEKKVRQYLFSRGFRYRKNDKRYPGKPDIVLPRYRTVIFVHGCFWHQHKNCRYSVMPKSNIDFWSKKLQGNVERDKRNIRYLKKLGWKVIVIWECQLKNNKFENKMKKVLKLIQQSSAV